jgi:pimeloyl-ACP methyl ester carboxylesterase
MGVDRRPSGECRLDPNRFPTEFAVADPDAAAALSGASPADVAKSLIEAGSKSVMMPLRPQDAALLDGAKAFRFGVDDARSAWSIGRGPLVLMAHGWGGRGVQMAPLARALASTGFRCVFFDAGGHGDSRPEPVGFHTFIDDAAALTRHVGEPVFAWIGHSAGGLGMMASRALRGVKANRYLCIAAPRFPYPPLEALRARMHLSEPILDNLKVILASQFETSWEALEAGAAYEPREAGKLLLIYDIDDPHVRHADADRIADRWPGAEIVKTKALGHNKMVQSPEALTRTVAFLTDGG